MGSMGPDIPAFSAALQPGQAWFFDTVHKGTPDSDRELLMASTCDAALEIWHEASIRLGVEGDREMLRAYVLGHLCHIAGDLISHPFVNDLEWHDGVETREKLSHGGGEGSLDAKVARSIFLRDGPRGGEAWGKWWPELGTGQGRVPEALFEAYEQALETVYKARSQRPRGFRDFERKLTELEPPGLDAVVRQGRLLALSLGRHRHRLRLRLRQMVRHAEHAVRTHDVHAAADAGAAARQTDVRASRTIRPRRMRSASGSRRCRCRSTSAPSKRSSSASGSPRSRRGA